MKKYNSVWMFLLLVVSINVFGKTLNKKDEIENSVISYQLAIYIHKFDLESIEEVAISLFKKQNSEFELVKEINLNLTTPQMRFQVLNDAQFDYAPPSVKMIDYFGRGITDEQAEEIQTIQKVLIINVAYNNENSWDRLQSVQFYTASIAKVLRGYVWDEETKEIFSIEEYINRRFFNPKLGAPSMQLHTVIHSYPEGNYVRAITLGMAKIGLPDIVINEFSWSRSSGVANAIVAITQLLAEGNRLNENNEFNLDLSKIKNEQYKSKLDDLLFENAKLKGIHQFNIAKVEEGDPNNLILEPIFKN